jgi:Reverse transcriptase (RNA-dependent DNA polymerase)
MFLEDEFLSKERSGIKTKLEEIQDPLPDASGQTEVEQVPSETVEQVQ